MPEPLRDSTREASASSRALSLRLKIWLACLGGALAASGALWWIAGTQIGPRDAADPALLVLSLLAASGLGLAIAVLFAQWLDHHLVGQVRGLSQALHSGQVEKLRDLPSTSGWGELSGLTQETHRLLTRDRELSEAGSERERFRSGVERLRASLDRWALEERWEMPSGLDDETLVLATALDRGLGRDREIAEQNREAVRLVREELLAAREDARESVEQAERGFVEATALLTTIRELQRLGGELQQVLATPEAPPVSDAPDRGAAFGEAARDAIEELVDASVESVEHLAGGLARVQDIVTQVQVIGNRSTLIALNATLTSGPASSGAWEELAHELKTLARDVRSASERTDELSRELERDVRAASTRMSDVRSSVADRLTAAVAPMPAPPAPAPSRSSEDARHLMDRVREMIQDATRKGERLSAAGERSSRAAQRLVRRLDEQLREFEGLAVRLGAGSGEESAEAEPAPLRLLPSTSDVETESEDDGDDGNGAEQRP